MNRLHLFNPDNDLALASGLSGYTPPKAAVRLARAGVLLPQWWADEGDYILARDYGDAERTALQCLADDQSDRFGLPHVTIVTGVLTEPAIPDPWGWSPSVRATFAAHMAHPVDMPSSETLAAMRALSHRRTAIRLAEAVDAPAAVEVSDTADLKSLILSRWPDMRCVVKAPWSSSGRGVMICSGMTMDEVLRRASGTIRHQDSVTVEPLHNKVTDLAALYRIGRGQVRLQSLSLCVNDSRGAYRGNVCVPDSDKVTLIGLDPRPAAIALEPELTSLLAELPDGWCGVDMLTARCPDGTLTLIPTVELNLRRTMGVAAMYIGGRLGRGTFAIAATQTADAIPVLPVTEPGIAFTFKSE